MSDADLYSRQGLGRRLVPGVAPALVVVDFQVAFADPGTLGGGNIGEAIAQTARLLAFARARGWPVAHTRVVYADDGADAGGFALKAPVLVELTEDAANSQIVPEVAPAPGELVVRKRGASAFFDTTLQGWLSFRRVDTVVVAGCTTSGCVRATVVDAMQHEFRPIVAVDCVGDRALGPHEANLFDMGQKYAQLMTRAEIEAADAA